MNKNKCTKLRAFIICWITVILLTLIMLTVENKPVVLLTSTTSPAIGKWHVSGNVLFSQKGALDKYRFLTRTGSFVLTVTGSSLTQEMYREQAIKVARGNIGKWSLNTPALVGSWLLYVVPLWLLWYFFAYRPQPDDALERASVAPPE